MHILDFPPGLLAWSVILAAALGAAMGSFLHCAAWRIARGESFTKGRSHCPECGHALGLPELPTTTTGEFCQSLIDNPIQLGATYEERSWQVFTNVFKIDLHQPFTCPGVADMIARLPLEFLTWEFITDDNAPHRAFLREQRAALGW